MNKSARKIFRCAIYTRVSTDDGLDQEFNSLDAQREASEAYIKSQTSEGWLLAPGQYDDGGYSGGSMDRPGLKKLLAAIQSGQVDIVVVYKVDRLTRSLSDFAKLVDLFDAHKVTFVSVTQSFNTTTSMGRLTLNMLLSFAQFEREVTGERIRDKIAASKKKGIWVGGVVPLGYRVQDRKLLVDREEADTVRLIFQRYLELHSLPALQRDLRQRGIVTRRRVLATGRIAGGVPLTNGPLRYMLRNRMYLGEINHRGASYPGEHEPIISNDVFDGVQAQLADNLNGHRRKREQSNALLLGIIFDDRGNRMSPTNSQKKGTIRYRYYTSCVMAQGRKAEAGSLPRVSAPAVEFLVLDALQSKHFKADTVRDLVRGNVARVEVRAGEIIVTLASKEIISIPWTPTSLVRKREIISSTKSEPLRPMKAEARVVLLRSIAQGRRWLDDLVKGRSDNLEAIATREGCSRRHVERTIANAFLAPQIVKAACEGRLPRGVNAKALAEAPAEWSAQLKRIGVASAD